MLKKIKSIYILRIIIKEHLEEKKYLQLVNYNKKFQKKLELSLENYINNYYRIELELLPIKIITEDKNIFINISIENKNYFMIYFNNKKVEQNYISKNDNNISKINIKINKEVNSLSGLFKNCKCLKEIKFTKFNRNDIFDLRELFYGCNSLTSLNLEKLNTENVYDMGNMFYECSSLKELNLNNFRTDNVDNMFEMFAFCSSLTKLEINNFKINDNVNCRFMFSHCSEELKSKIMEQFKDLPESTYLDYVEE